MIRGLGADGSGPDDLVGTLLSFSWVVVDALRKLGVRIDDQEAEDYHYRWRVIGQMLGIEPDAIPVDLAHAGALTREIARRNHRRLRATCSATTCARSRGCRAVAGTRR